MQVGVERAGQWVGKREWESVLANCLSQPPVDVSGRAGGWGGTDRANTLIKINQHRKNRQVPNMRRRSPSGHALAGALCQTISV